MRLTPLDIQSHAFGRRWNGFDAEEVHAFLRVIADDYEALVRETESRADQIRRLEARVEELSLNEALLKETLLTAQNLGNQLRNTAAKEAEATIGQAEVQAEKILQAAHRRAARLADEIREMRALRTRLASGLRSQIDTHLAMIDALSEDHAEDAVIEGKVAFLAAATRRAPSRKTEPGRSEE